MCSLDYLTLNPHRKGTGGVPRVSEHLPKSSQGSYTKVSNIRIIFMHVHTEAQRGQVVSVTIHDYWALWLMRPQYFALSPSTGRVHFPTPLVKLALWFALANRTWRWYYLNSRALAFRAALGKITQGRGSPGQSVWGWLDQGMPANSQYLQPFWTFLYSPASSEMQP
jgi:hypothetical protein